MSKAGAIDFARKSSTKTRLIEFTWREGSVKVRQTALACGENNVGARSIGNENGHKDRCSDK